MDEADKPTHPQPFQPGPEMTDGQAQVQPSEMPPYTPLMDQPTPRTLPALAYEQYGPTYETIVPRPLLSEQPSLYTDQVGYAQAAHPAFFNQAQKLPARSRKRRVLLWGILSIVLVLLITGVATVTHALGSIPPSPDATLQTYCQGFKDKDVRKVYDTFSHDARAKVSFQELQQTFAEFDELNSLGMSYDDCTYNNIRVSGTLAVAIITLTLSITANGQTSTLPNPGLASLVLENNQWKVDFSVLMQAAPDLTGSASMTNS